MFGKRRQDHKHRYAEEVTDDVPEDDARPGSDDPQLAEALFQLARNRHAPLVEPLSESRPEERPAPNAPSSPDEAAKPGESSGQDEPPASDRGAKGRAHAGVPTAAMLAEPESQPEGIEAKPDSVDETATYAALRRERAKVVEQDAALQKARDEIASLRAELKRGQSAAAERSADAQAASRANELDQSLRESQKRVEKLTAELTEYRKTPGDKDAAALTAAVERADAAERTVAELKSKVSTLTAELERSRSEAAAAAVALERFTREAKDQDGTVAAAEERAERLAAEVERLRAEAAKGPAQVERLRREADRESAMRAALEQAQASHAQAQAVLADNRRLASDLAAKLQSQEGLIAALTGLQTEVTEQRGWFEAQIANQRDAESQQASLVESLQAAIQDRDVELELLRQQLLEAEAKRAEEAAAFVAALDRQ